MNIVIGVAAAVAAGSGVGVGLADPRTHHRKNPSQRKSHLYTGLP